MRIIIPVLGFAAAGGYRVLSELANQWVLQGHDVAFLTAAGEAPPAFPTTAAVLEVSDNGEISEPSQQRPPRLLHGLRKLLALYRGLSRIGPGYDVILANHSFTPWAIAAARTGNAKSFYYIQAYEPEYFKLEKQWLNWLVARASYFLPLVQLANTRVYNRHAGVKPVAIVPAGIDLGVYHPKANRRVFEDGSDIVLGCIGRREPSKGTQYVLDAFTELAASDNRYRLRVAYGNLPEGWSHPRCDIVVPANDGELATFYRSVDIMVAAGTVQHGAPHYPVIEAMASGTPVVTTGYMPADPGNSWLVINRNSAAVAAGIAAIVSDPNYGRRVDRALEAVQALSWPAMSAMMVAEFDRALDSGPASL
jgi:glycosyltransferase involved in cell wall biosynthesis